MSRGNCNIKEILIIMYKQLLTPKTPGGYKMSAKDKPMCTTLRIKPVPTTDADGVAFKPVSLSL